MSSYGNADLTRLSILKAAILIISNKGLDALTASRLIEQAKISKGGLYHHFKTMSAVKIAVLELLTQDLLREIKAHPQPRTKEGFFDLVERELFECFMVDKPSTKALFGFFSASIHNKTSQLIFRRFMDEIGLVRCEQLRGVSSTVSPIELHHIVQVLFSLQIGLTTRYFLSEDPVSLRNYWQACRKTLAGILERSEHQSYRLNKMDFC